MNFPEASDINTADDILTLSLNIDKKLDAFDGHFDTFPIVPGVVQIQWALHFFKKHHPKGLALADQASINKMSALKFQHVITPESSVELHLNFDSTKNCIQFSLHSAEHRYSSGKIFLDQDN